MSGSSAPAVPHRVGPPPTRAGLLHRLRDDGSRVVAVVSLAHGCSHFSHLIVAPLFPWLKDAFGLSYSELGLLMTVFFVVSGVGQTLAGFLVDRVGGVPVLLGSLALLALGAIVLSLAPGYPALMFGCALVGLGNSPFHPVDFSILNARVAPSRLGRAYAIHGIAGNLGWAVAPVFLAGMAAATDWRTALAAAAALFAAVLALVWRSRERLAGRPVDGFGRARVAGRAGAPASGTLRGDGHAAAAGGSAFGFLKLPAVWMSFAFFFTLAVALGGVQTFGPESARVLHAVDARWVALCLTLYMLTGAVGQLVGGHLVTDPARAERIVVAGFGLSMGVAALLGLVSWPGWMVPVLFAAMGFGSGVAGPSRDLMVRRASPPGATGRVYGTVYAGLDVGMAVGPVVFGWLLDHGQPRAVWIGIALFQLLLVLNALNLGRMTRAGAARGAGAGAAAAR